MSITDFFESFLGSSSSSFMVELFACVLLLVIVDLIVKFILGTFSYMFTFRGR